MPALAVGQSTNNGSPLCFQRQMLPNISSQTNPNMAGYRVSGARKSEK